ncbi:MAG: hypothetical protein U5K54_29115 [Cytophagales bacterium]|nr:hypothetical protein [Cytophagales bacterium]
MKITFKLLTVLALVVGMASCNDRAAEKRIAELESRLAQIEGNKGATPVATSDAAAPVAEVKPEGPLPVAQFERVEHDFGTITEGKRLPAPIS